MLILIKRNDEVAMLVLQDNALRHLRLIAADDAALKIISLENDDFLLLLSSKQQAHIREELQYETAQKDLLEIMQHMQHLNFAGNDEAFAFRMVRELPQGRNDVFRIILLQSARKQKIEALQQNMAGHAVLDEPSGLPNAISMLRFVELAQNYSDIAMAFVFVEIVGQNADLQRIIAQAIRRNLRQDDVIGLLEGGAAGILLADVNVDSAHLAINRLRTTLARDPLLSQNRTPYHLRFGGVAINSEKSATEIMSLAKNILASDANKEIIFKC